MYQSSRGAGQATAIIAAVFAGLMVIGLFGPWYVTLFDEWNGIEGAGLLALLPVVAVVVGAIARLAQQEVRRWPAITMTFGFLVGLGAGGLAFAVIVAEARRQLDDYGFTASAIGWGLLLFMTAALAGLITSIILWVRDAGSGTRQPAQVAAGPSINIVNQAGWGNQAGPVAPAYGRVGVIEQGRRLPEVQVLPGQSVVVGRGPEAHVRLTDKRASRNHLQLAIQGNSWVVQDRGSTNAAQVIAGELRGQYIGHSAVRMQAGQLRIGQSVITLFPVEGGR